MINIFFSLSSQNLKFHIKFFTNSRKIQETITSWKKTVTKKAHNWVVSLLYFILFLFFFVFKGGGGEPSLAMTYPICLGWPLDFFSSTLNVCFQTTLFQVSWTSPPNFLYLTHMIGIQGGPFTCLLYTHPNHLTKIILDFLIYWSYS